MVCALNRAWKILEAPLVAPADIFLRNIVTASKNSILNSSEIDLDILRTNVDQHDLKASLSRSEHHS